MRQQTPPHSLIFRQVLPPITCRFRGPERTCLYCMVWPTRLVPSEATSTTHTRCLVPTRSAWASVKDSVRFVISRLRFFTIVEGVCSTDQTR